MFCSAACAGSPAGRAQHRDELAFRFLLAADEELIVDDVCHHVDVSDVSGGVVVREEASAKRKSNKKRKKLRRLKAPDVNAGIESSGEESGDGAGRVRKVGGRLHSENDSVNDKTVPGNSSNVQGRDEGTPLIPLTTTWFIPFYSR